MPVLLARVRATRRITSALGMSYTDSPSSHRLPSRSCPRCSPAMNAHRPAHRMALLSNLLGSQTYHILIPALPDQSPRDPRPIRPASGAPEPADLAHAPLRIVRPLPCRSTPWPPSSMFPPCIRPALYSWAVLRRPQRQTRLRGCT